MTHLANICRRMGIVYLYIYKYNVSVLCCPKLSHIDRTREGRRQNVEKSKIFWNSLNNNENVYASGKEADNDYM